MSSDANKHLKAILRAGYMFEGKYRILRPLGAGSFAVVVHAKHNVMGRDVALKLLKPKVVEDNPEVSERFVKEVQIASRLKHPNVVAIYDFGETPEGIYYMVQEYVDGVTVDEIMPPGKPLPRDRALDVVLQVLSCLEEAHSQGIIHRDLKPSNLMSTKGEAGEEVIKILDFGVAKLLEGDDDSSSQSRQSTKFIGTPIYMSPEQILGREVQPSSDLYSVGLMLYEMLTGQAPIQAEQIAEVVRQHLSDQPFEFPMLHLLEDNLQRVILKATERHPELRFQDAETFIEALQGDWNAAEAADTQMATAAEIARATSGLGAEASSEGDDLDAFLGRNYIGLDEEDFAPTFEPLPPERQRRQTNSVSALEAAALEDEQDEAPSQASVELDRELATPHAASSRSPKSPAPASTSASTTSALTEMSGDLELDMDAMRSVRKQRQRAARQDRERVRRDLKLEAEPERDIAGRALLYTSAALAYYINFVFLSVVTDGMPGSVRVLAGLSPLVVAAGWVAMESRPPGDVGSRWLIPISTRGFILLAVVVVGLALIVPGRAEIAFKHEGIWFFEALPKVPPLTWLEALTNIITQALAGVFGSLADALPWAK